MLKINNILHLLVTFIIVTYSLTGFTQENNTTSSPYSRYGLGTLSNYSFGRTEAMGGIGIGTRYGYQINTANPASYTAIDSMTFLMEFGVNSRHTIYKTETASSASNDANFNYLAFSFPVTRWWAAAFALTPYSHVGYNIESLQETIQNGDTSRTAFNYSGNGSLSKVIFGNSFDLNDNLSIGINTWFLFGELNNVTSEVTDQINAYNIFREESKLINGFGFTFGLQYQLLTQKNNRLVFGAVIEPSNNISSDYSLSLIRNLNGSSGIISTDTLSVSPNNADLKLPLSYGVGLSYEVKDKLTIGADYYHQDWSEATYSGFTPENVTDRDRYSAGLEYVPNNMSLRSYWKRINYRVGAFYENSYLMFNDSQINSKGITFGIGLPLKRSRTSLNLSAELGKLGTTSNNSAEESYAKFTLQILLHDRWFFKKKIE